MWQVEPGLLCIAADRVVLRSPGAAPVEQLFPVDAGCEAVLALVRDMLATVPAGAWSVWLADRFVTWLDLPWDESMLSAATAGNSLRQRAVAAWGNDVENWLWRVDDAPAGALRMAVGVAPEWVSGLREALAITGHRLQLMQPLSTALPAADGAQAIHDADTLTLCARRAGHLCHVSVHRHDGDADAALRVQWRRLQLRDPSLSAVPAPALHPVARAWQQPVDDVPSVFDFVSQSAAPRGWRLLVPVAGLLLLALAGWQLLQVQWRVAEAAAALDALHQRPAPVVAAGREQQALVRTVNGAITQLNVPVTALLRAAQPEDVQSVGLLGFDLGNGRNAAGQSMVRIVAEARTAADMTRYIDALAGRVPLRSAYLVHHEIDGDSPGRPYRFTVEAAWQE